MANTSSMNFQSYLEDTYRIIKEEPIILILGGFVIQLLTLLSMGILAGPLVGGYFLVIIIYLRDNRKPSFNDIFSGLQQFGNLFPYFFVMLIILVGFMLLILPGFLFATWWLYVLPLMADRKISFSEAMKLSMNKVNETGFLMHFVFLLLITFIPMMLLNFLGTVIPFLFVLKILLPPFQAGCLASLYIDQFGCTEPVPAAPVDIQPPPLPRTDSQPETADTEVPAEQAEAAADLTETVDDDRESPDEIPGNNTEKQTHIISEENKEDNQDKS